VSVLYPLVKFDAYSSDMFCIAETFGCVYSIYTGNILATGSAYLFRYISG